MLEGIPDRDERMRWLEELEGPLPGEARDFDVDPEAELAQLNNL